MVVTIVLEASSSVVLGEESPQVWSPPRFGAFLGIGGRGTTTPWCDSPARMGVGLMGRFCGLQLCPGCESQGTVGRGGFLSQ